MVMYALLLPNDSCVLICNSECPCIDLRVPETYAYILKIAVSDKLIS